MRSLLVVLRDGSLFSPPRETCMQETFTSFFLPDDLLPLLLNRYGQNPS